MAQLMFISVIYFNICLLCTGVGGRGIRLEHKGTVPNLSDGCTDSSFKGIINYCSKNASQVGCSLTWDGVQTKCYLIGMSLLVLTIIVIIIIIAIAFYIIYKYCTRRARTERDGYRQVQEENERLEATALAGSKWKDHYHFVNCLATMGSRLQKYWFEMKDIQTGEVCIQTIAQSSKNCRIAIDDSDTVKTINELFVVLKQHQPHLHIIYGLRSEQGKVSIVQPFMESGSLRDMIYKEIPTKDWNDKYSGEPCILPMETVKECGRHVLQAVCFLYKQGFPPLGHIHTGNIFQTERGFVLGGYENTLLGYKTRRYRKLAEGNHLDKIDVIMFGHVIYEMSSGHVLSEVFPTEEEYERVRYREVKNLLHFIFNLEVPGVRQWRLWKKSEGAHKKIMKKITEHKFFRDKVRYDNVLTPEQRALLALVREETPNPPDGSSRSATRLGKLFNSGHSSDAGSVSSPETVPLLARSLIPNRHQ